MLIQLFLLILVCLSVCESSISDSCPKYRFNNQTLHDVLTSTVYGDVEIKYFDKKLKDHYVMGNMVMVYTNKIKALQSLNREDGCEKGIKAVPTLTSKVADNCEIVMNAGFFDVSNGKCYGNVINNGKVYINSGGIRNAHFGVLKNGSYYFGYPTEAEVNSGRFEMLIGGAIWLIRKGKNVIEKSIKSECSAIEGSGSLSNLCNIRSARSIVGAFSDGRIFFLHVNGRSGTKMGVGITLYEAIELLNTFPNVLQAINLDGGGSSGLVINNTLVSLPGDPCKSEGSSVSPFSCQRPVSTVICIQSRSSITAYLQRIEKLVFSKHMVIIILAGLLSLTVFALIFVIFLYVRRNYGTIRQGRGRHNVLELKLDENLSDDMVYFDKKPLLLNSDVQDL